MHLQCQQEVMTRTRSHQKGCPICLCDYTNVRRAVVHRQLTGNGMRLIAYYCGVVLVICISAYEAVMYGIVRHYSFLIVSILFLLCAVCSVKVGLALFEGATIWTETQVVTIHRPAAAADVV